MRGWALLVFAACDAEVTLHLTRPWDAEAPAVFVTLDGDRRPVASPLMRRPGEPFFLRVDRGEVREVVALAFDPDARAPDQSPLVDCGVLFADDWAFAAPAATFTTGPLDEETAEVVLAMQAAEVELPFALRHERCLDVQDPCAGLDVDSMHAPGIDGVVMGVGLSDNDAAYLKESEAGAVTLVELHNFDIATVEPAPALTFRANAIAAFDSVLYLAGTPDNPSSTLIALGLDGLLRPAPDVRMQDSAPELSIGLDGSGLIGGLDGVRRFAAGSTTSEPLDPPIDNVEALASVRRDRSVIIDASRAIHVGGENYSVEWQPTVGNFVDLTTAHGDDTQLLAAGTLSNILRRDEARGEWLGIDPPELGNIRQIVALQGGRFAILTELNHFAIHTGRAWCQYADEERYFYAHLAASPSGLTLYLVGRDRSGDVPGTTFKRVQLPRR